MEVISVIQKQFRSKLHLACSNYLEDYKTLRMVPYCYSLGVVVFESVQNGGHNGRNGQHNANDLQEMSKNCYRGDLFANNSLNVVFLQMKGHTSL